ncbi:MAG: LLM class flavin-dependent oxidoreductase [Chloroflexi bacterium]|nr:LLM class flavin-dependent oxidoreductase [Chloroflexota bacterium]MBT4073800.1 LLM class flavin-dependent oxidoreductase [Chloroflexota bacterium]MBT4515204.1 LLM class flavin-dependent oxidoreductase [Chloroflexota bacterium]MBT5318406.1 LLM class flavin-dependent oxidoreductase [Chloroflexota bacterium]MBT6683105.1 LLM class flavin-dependent oxidoreductase [Chloroflexota bacterium]
MDFGYSMESHVRGESAAEIHDAYREFFTQVQICEDGGMDFLWISEHHFNPDRSFGSASMVVAGAIAAKTERIKIGSSIIVLPTHNPLHVAEEVANMDHISNGRFEFGVGRSGGVGGYKGFNMDYGESQPRFAECLEIVKLALENERFSYKGEYYEFNDVPMFPRPYTTPYPKIRWAVNSNSTFEMAGEMGLPIFCGVLQLTVEQLSELLANYDAARAKAGFTGPRDAELRIPIYVSDTMDDALKTPMEGFTRRYSSASEILQRMVASGQANYMAERTERIDSLGNLDWEGVYSSEKAIVGTPDVVIDKIKEIGDALQLSGMVLEFNAGERMSEAKINRSLELFCEKVLPAFN